MKIKKNVLLLLAIIIAGLLLYVFIIEPNFMIMKTELTLSFSDLPDNFNGFRIVQISDTHFGMWHLALRDNLVIQAIKELKPDIIVLTGDIICSGNGLEEALRFVAHVTSIAPTFVVLGNWDYWSGVDIAKFIEGLRGLGAIILMNNSTAISRGDEAIWIIGVDDPYTWRDNLTQALLHVPSNAFKVLLAHSPQIFKEARGKVDLVLAGHTHGGQVNIPFIGPLFIPLPAGSRRYVAGIFNESETIMYVNRGIGCSMMPIRFMCPPEVALITLIKS